MAAFNGPVLMKMRNCATKVREKISAGSRTAATANITGAASARLKPEIQIPPFGHRRSPQSPNKPPARVPRTPAVAVMPPKISPELDSESPRSRLRKVGIQLASPPIEKVIRVRPTDTVQKILFRES